MFNLPNLSSKALLLSSASLAAILITANTANATTFSGMTGRGAAQVSGNAAPKPPAGFGTASTPGQAAQATAQSSADFSTALARIQAQMSAQATARAAAAAGPNNLGADPNHPGQNLPDVPNGLAQGGLVAHANPSAADNTAGLVWENANAPTQATSGANTTVTVQQTAQKAILTWDSFNVGKNTTVHFDQTKGTQADGSNTWIALNRIVDPSLRPSQILGNITAEGSVYLINKNGIIFGGTSQVNVHSLVASSLNLFNNNLLASNDRFRTGGIGDLNQANFATNAILLTSDAPGAGDVTIETGASIALGTQGLGVIAAPNVTNSGTIIAPSGQAALIAGVGVSYDYNVTSFNAGGNSGGSQHTQGYNDNSTTNLRFANHGTLTDSQGNDITPVGTLTNTGLIYTPRGNVTLLGGAVQQDGIAVATTSTAQPGSIMIESLYEVGRGSIYPADESSNGFYTGSVSFGPGAVTAILPDANGVTLASDPGSLAPFLAAQPLGAQFLTPLPTQGLGLIEVIGQGIDFRGGSLTYAPGQNLSTSAIVLADPRMSMPGAGRVLLEDGAVLDVSGLTDVQVPISSTLLTVKLAGNELADDPEQRNGLLYGQTVTVDMTRGGTNAETGEAWVGTPLANLAGYANLVQNSIGQLLVNGGTISLSGSEVDAAAGSVMNLQGGYVHYLGGVTQTTRLIGADGRLYDIGSASPDMTYVAFAGQSSLNHARWGITDAYSNPLLAGAIGAYLPDDIQGGNAGSLSIGASDVGYYGAAVAPGAGVIVIQSALSAGTVTGNRQAASGALPANGSFGLGGTLAFEIADPILMTASEAADAGLPSGFGMSSPLLGSGSGRSLNVIGTTVLNNGDFGTISITATGTAITEDAGATLAVQPGGAIDLTGGNVTISGGLTARAGQINITTLPIDPTTGAHSQSPGDIVIGAGAALDVSGFFVNNLPLSPNQQISAALINAGSIALVANEALNGNTDLTGNITLEAGSLLNLKGGGLIKSNGRMLSDSNGVPQGRGGNLTLTAYQGIGTPVIVGAPPARGVLTLDGAIDALGFNGGGALNLQAVALQIGGDAAATPSYAFHFDPTVWGGRGFASFNLSSVLQSEVPAGAQVRLTHANLLPDLRAILKAPNGADPAAYASAGQLTGTQLSPTDLSITAGLEQKANAFYTSGGSDYAQIDPGAQILADPGAAVSLDSYAMVTIFGAIHAPGGAITLTHDYAPLIQGGGPLGPIYLGPQSVLDVAGVAITDPQPAAVATANGLVFPHGGEVLPGGTVTIVDKHSPILVAPGAVIDVSGAAGVFDVEQLVSGGMVGGRQGVLTPQPMWSDAGSVSITGGTDLLFEGTLVGNPGAPQANGGTLQVSGVVNAESGTDTSVILVQDTAATLKAAGSTFDFATYVPAAGLFGSATAQIPAVSQIMLVGADTLQDSGFSSLALGSSRLVGYAGQVSLSLGASFSTSSSYLGAYADSLKLILTGGPVTNGASLSVTAPYISILGNGVTVNGPPSPPSQAPATADATMSLNADALDLSGFLYLQDIGQATFSSKGDLRLLPAPYAPQSGTNLLGYLLTAGNLTFQAADLYPATDTAFVIEALPRQATSPTTITFAYPDGVAPSTTTPLSVGGSLIVDASTIVQNGEIQAPFGSIFLGLSDPTALGTILGTPQTAFFLSPINPQSVTLGSGSITSVSANGALIPYGSTVDQTTWTYNPQTNNPAWDSGVSQAAFTYPLTGAPQGVVTLNGNNIDFGAGAVIDLDGGGGLYAQEWIAGTGGSRNVLAQSQTSYQNAVAGQRTPTYADGRTIYAIVPGFNGALAPYDANLSQPGLGAGQAIYLNGGNGLAAGVYTLLPAQYATLPGAYRVVANSGVVNPVTNQSVTLPDGTILATGYLTNTLTGARPSSTQQFYVQPAATWQGYSQYVLTDAASFFPAYAAANGLSAPHVPADAGRLAIAAGSDLVLQGTMLGRPGKGGVGAQADISGQYIEITDDSTGLTTVVTGALSFNASGTSNALGSGATVNLSGTLGPNDIFTITGGRGSFSQVIGTLNVPAGSTANLVWQSGNGSLTLTNNSIVLGSGDTFTVSGGTVAVKTQGADIVQLGGNQYMPLPASSATAIQLPQAGSTFTYSNGSGSGASAIKISSSHAFSVGGTSVPLDPATGLYTTSAYTAGQTVQGTAAGQVINWTTGSAAGAGTGAGGTLRFTSFTGNLSLGLAPAVPNTTVTYDLGNGGVTVTALSPQDLASGNFLLRGNTSSAVVYAPGSYPVLYSQAFGGFTGTAPVTFTANTLDQVSYTGTDPAVSLPTTQTYLQLSAKQLDSLGATSLLIGGLRSPTSVGEVITPTANGIIVANDSAAPLAAPEVMLVAAPQLASTTLTLDRDSDTAAISTPLAGTGQIVFETGSVVEAQGAVAAGEPTTLYLGSTLANLPALPGNLFVSEIQGTATATPKTALANYYAGIGAALGTLVRLSNGGPVNLVLPSAAELNPGTISVTDNVNTANSTYSIALPSLAGFGGAVVQPGATLLGGAELTLVATGDVQVRSGALLSGNNINLNSSQITFVGSGTPPTGGAVIDPVTLVQLQNAASINLQSASTIAFQGNVAIAMGNGALTLGAGSFMSDGGQVSLDAGTLTLDNERGAPTPAATGGSGTLTIDVDTLIFGAGGKSLQGFGAVNIMASQGIVGQGTGSMDFGSLPVTLQTPALIAQASSTQRLTTTGALSIVPISGGGGAAIPTSLGGAIALQGGSVDVAVPIEAPAGNISLMASAGDVTVSSGGQLIASGAALPFHDLTEYASAGTIRLSAVDGSVNIQPGAVVDVSGAVGGGAGGSLSIVTTGSTAPILLGGTLLGATAAGATGSNFSLDTGGPVALDALAQLLTGAGVTGNIAVESGVGDLALNGILTGSRVTLTADAGAVTVNGAITANGAGTTVGQIGLYGVTGVDVEGTLLATGAPSSQKPGGVINIGTSGVGSTTSLNAAYGYENVDPSASGTITIGPKALIDASGGTVTFRAPLLDAVNAQGANVNIAIASGARIDGGAVNLDAYAVWSTADQSTNPNRHFDGYVDPAGWYDNNGNLVSGVFTNASGNVVLNYTAGSMTAAQLASYLTNDYFAPTTGYAAHAVFYGGYNPNSESFNPSAPDAGSLPAFIQNPGFNLGNTFAGVANFQARPEVDLVNPSSANGGVNGGNITVLTNWNLGAGVMNPDGSLTLAYRYQGAVAPVIALRAAGNVRADASITDGFFQTAGVSLTNPASVMAQFELTYAYADQQYASFSQSYGDPSTAVIQYYDGSTGPLVGSIDPNAALNAPMQGGSTLYYQNYIAYLNNWVQNWSNTVYDNGYLIPVTAPGVSAPNPPSASDPNYIADYQNYLATYSNWLQTYFTPSTLFSAGTPSAPATPANPTQYLNYISADAGYINYVYNNDYYYDPGTGAFAIPVIYAPFAPSLTTESVSPPPLPIPAGANAPSNMPTAANPSPVQFASLVGGQSASYAIVAGANLASANPLAVAPAAQFAPGSTSGLAGEGNVTLDHHTAYTIVNSYEIVAPTTIRTGSGSIDIAAPENFKLLDTLAPGVVYTAGVPVQPAPANDGTTVVLGGGAFHTFSSGYGVSTILTPAVNAGEAGDLTLTVGGDIVGMENVVDTLATSSFLPSGLSSKAGAFVGQFWEQWLLNNPATPDVPWYVNFGSFDQGLMSIGGNVTIRAGGSIHDLAVSLPTTGYLDASNGLHVTGGGTLSVTAGGSIYSGDFYVGAGAGTIKAGDTIAPDFSYLSTDDTSHTYPVATLLAVQYGTIAVGARGSVEIGGIYDPTYLWAPKMGGGTLTPPVASYAYVTLTTAGVDENLIPYFTSMGPASGVSVQATSGSLTLNSAIAFGDMLGMGTGSGVGSPYVTNTAAFVSSLLLPASLDLAALGGDINIGYGGGLYPSATGTLSLIADQSINLGIPLLTGNGFSSEPLFTEVGNVFGTTLEKLAYPVGTGILPTASNPALVPVWNLPGSQTYDPALIADQASTPVHVYALNGSIVDGVQVTAADGGIRQWVNNGNGIVTTGNISNLPVNVAVGGTVDQISLIPNAPAEIYAGQDILDLPFYGSNFTAGDVTSLIAGRDIRYNIYGDQQSPAIELAGPGTLDVIAGRNLSFESQRIAGVTESGIRTIGNAIDTAADPILNTSAPTGTSYPYSPLSFMGDFGNPYLPNGGAATNVLFGVGQGINVAGFISAYIDPAASGAAGSAASLVGFVTQYEKARGAPVPATLGTEQAWAIFETLPAAQQQLLAEQVFFGVLNQTGLDYNNPASPYFHQYARGYQAINTLFPASDGYTHNSLDGGSNGANQLVSTGAFDMRGSTVQTQQGGSISILGPGGRILVGSSGASPAVNPASEGILTLEQGDIDIFTDTDVLVAQSRVMTEQGGAILMWSSNGNLDAGKGTKTSVSAPPPLYACGIEWICTADIKGQVSGAGIATLQSLPGVPVGNANLIAPRGTVDAGAAGIRVSGNLNIAALAVANAFNIEVKGLTSGIPLPVTNLTLTTASTAATEAAQIVHNIASHTESQVSVEVTGFGSECVPSADQPCN